jgi:hypothetical protein
MVSEQPGALAGSPDLLLPLAESGPYNHEGYRTFDRRPRWLLANVEDEDGEEDGEEEGEEEKDDEDEFSILDEIGDPFKNMHERYVREREARLAEIKKKHDEGQELSESDKWYYNYWQRLKRKKWVDKQVKKKRLPRDKAEEAADRLGGFAEIK